MIKPYILTGVGSRQCPEDVYQIFYDMTSAMMTGMHSRFLGRTGDAAGADHAFRSSFRTYSLPTNNDYEVYSARDDIQDEAFDMAMSIHPAWERLSEYEKRLHARNCYQVLGKNLDMPSDSLVCWTKDGKPSGGTRTAIILAIRHNIPVYNFYHDKDRQEFQKVLDSLGVDYQIPLKTTPTTLHGFFE